MPAKSPEAKARKAKRHEERRKERGITRESRRSPEAKGRKSRRQDDRRKSVRQKAQLARPFVGCDGEGAADGDGSRYVLFRMGTRELWRGGARLTTPELLQFICDHPDAAAILVGFFFDYDVSNILFDVPSARDPKRPLEISPIERILQVDLKGADGDPNPYKFGGWTHLKFKGYPLFGVQYLPRNQIEVCRREWGEIKKKGAAPRMGWRTVAGSIRRIYDVQGFYQCSFVKALELWGIDAARLPLIAAMKAKRSTFTGTQEERDYCQWECDDLAELMEQFRAQCVATDMVPRTWNGAGKIASMLLKRHGAMTAKRLAEVTPPPVLDLAHAAYYGGRFETPWIGRLPETWEHDIGSAYPAAMLKLPCLEHGRWIECNGDDLDQLGDDALFVARLHYWHPPKQFLCGFPHRSKQGRLSWPREGNGVYWSPEIRSAQRLGAVVTFKGGYRFETDCDCHANGFISSLYELRRQIGKSVRGIPIKLGINSCYGKKAQRIGKPVYANPIDAGLITAITRAAINDAIVAAGDQRRVVMIATDGIYTVEGPIAGLDLGDGLGQWEAKRFPSLFIVRPGLYWPPAGAGSLGSNRKLKTRGLSPKFFEPLIPTFEAAWDAWLDEGASPFGVPMVPVPIRTFVGVRLALRQGKPDQRCQWIERDVQCRFNWKDKRRGSQMLGDALCLGPLPGGPDEHSHHYDASAVMASSTVFEMDRMIFEAQPDFLDLTPPFTDALPEDEELI
jgi:DNA polymerase type B, organellar and viral